MSDLEIMAAALYRYLTGRPWVIADTQQRMNYLAICLQTVEQVKAELAQQPQGQKEVA